MCLSVVRGVAISDASVRLSFRAFEVMLSASSALAPGARPMLAASAMAIRPSLPADGASALGNWRVRSIDTALISVVSARA